MKMCRQCEINPVTKGHCNKCDRCLEGFSMSKEIFTEEEIGYLWSHLKILGVSQFTRQLNLLAKEKRLVSLDDMQECYSQDEDVNLISVNKYSCDTHKAYVHFEPLEPEKPKCELDHKTVIETLDAVFKDVQGAKCPKCYEQLNKEPQQ